MTHPVHPAESAARIDRGLPFRSTSMLNRNQNRLRWNSGFGPKKAEAAGKLGFCRDSRIIENKTLTKRSGSR